MDIIVNISVGDDEKPEVKVQQPAKKKLAKGGVLQFPEETSENNAILDMLGIRET
jgi:hypothetical protein